jgi:hypothetical protein
MIGQDPSVSNTNQLHVDIFWFSYVEWRNIIYIGKKFEVLNFNWLFSQTQPAHL